MIRPEIASSDEFQMARRRLTRTFVYAMRNERNGFTKIGRSDNPKFREKTLHSEEPEITILFAYFVEPYLERELHEVLESWGLRVRGEWFDLTEDALRVVRDACEMNIAVLEEGVN